MARVHGAEMKRRSSHELSGLNASIAILFAFAGVSHRGQYVTSKGCGDCAKCEQIASLARSDSDSQEVDRCEI